MARKASLNEASMFPESKLPLPTPEQAGKISALSKSRDGFAQAVIAYRTLLQDQTLASQKSQTQRDKQTKVMQDLNIYGGDLESMNLGEGLFSLAFVALNSLLTLRDELNDIKFQNVMLHKKIKELES